MKILQISPLFYPHIGGIEKHVKELSHMLVNHGHEVTVYTSNLPHSVNEENISGLEVRRFNCMISLLNNQFCPGFLPAILKKNDFDIIHIHSHLHLGTIS